MADQHFAPDYSETPYWWADATPYPAQAELTKKADVVIIGGGYTGLHAGIQTARAGMDTVVVDAEDLGWGCSTRNGGQISTSIKPTYSELVGRFGSDQALAIYREGQNSLSWTQEFIETEQIECDFDVVGRYHAAHSPRHYEKLARNLAPAREELADDAFLIPRDEQYKELGTDAYYGGVVYPRHGSLHPAKYHAGLVATAEKAGAKLIAQCPATNINRESKGFTVHTAKGEIHAKKVVLATNGYSGSLSRWHQRRVIPIGSYVIATDIIDPQLMKKLMPTNRIISDTRKVVYYYRPSPDHKRIIFGGRVSLSETNPRSSGEKLHKVLRNVFPELEGIGISSSWMGFVAFTFDSLMNAGEEDNLYYAMGYCGSGVGMAGYLGMKTGLKVAGKAEGKTAFDNVPFQTRPLYSGNPWFLAPSVLFYKMRDSLGI
ncbi:NAD(P)/FAD-dependent oxidoreductase [Sneathiella limimaris]|uniref:NAD(P)/FAD-dependent oxidoreductase n=1 Tax=Sneathiella limimaris TaxID=1964213 RepID=UPI00146A58A3|nr:FAD-binding oxidoreductase [Sneathiella limimaris]